MSDPSDDAGFGAPRETYAANEDRATRIKRLRIRSWRRGIKEMDLILGGFVDRGGLADLNDAELDTYDQMLTENDQDLYFWASGQGHTPEPYRALLGQIVASSEVLR